ncbi:hypothetical protein MYX77_00880 [Acidobacteriia bacterium AH_259_A11_L15]|nr:hypothetical protein [Acidobacteriia bacterium AH_259_A11_L15]
MEVFEMIPYRISTDKDANPELKRKEVKDKRLGNTKWFSQYGRAYAKPGSILLLGGTSVSDFRLRVAQSHARGDLLPSYWSHVAILVEGRGNSWSLSEVSLNPPNGFGDAPRNNARQTSQLKHYDDPDLWPNIAVLSFFVDGREVVKASDQVARNRGTIDLCALVVPWLAFVWGAGNAPNPLLQDKGIPSAVFVETVMGILGFDLTPGLSSQSSCPEAIWQSVKWWHSFYRETTGQNKPPAGVYTIRQQSAAVVE